MTLVNHRGSNVAKAAVALSAPFIPFQPVVTAGLHGLGIEAVLLQKLIANPEMRKLGAAHYAAGLGAVACFNLENVYKEIPYLHASWHVLGALAIHLSNKVMFAKQ